MAKASELRFEVLLRAEKRTPQAVRAVADALREMGAEIASEGSASVTLRIPKSAAGKFIAIARKAAVLDPNANAAVEPEAAGDDVKVPDALRDNVELISIPSRHIQF
jgi:hypothetical protein